MKSFTVNIGPTRCRALLVYHHEMGHLHAYCKKCGFAGSVFGITKPKAMPIFVAEHGRLGGPVTCKDKVKK